MNGLIGGGWWGRGLRAGLCACAAWAQAAGPADPVTVTETGAARMRILTAAAEPGAPSPAALELRDYLKKISGAELEIAPAAPGAAGLYVGKAADFPWLGLDAVVKDLGAEGCLVRSDGTNLFLLGAEDKGAAHAVFTFLQALGCRWFFPGDTWEALPRLATIRGVWNEAHTPSYDIQRHLGYGFGAYARNAEDKRNWDRRNRMGSAFPVSIGHAGHGLSAQDFEKTPELFAMRDGKRVQGSKPCFSHPEFVRRTVSNVLQRAAAGARMIPLTPADGLGYCECPLCHEWAKGGEVFWDKGSQFARRPDGVLVCLTSESLFHCINAAARALREAHPGVLIGTYAYSAYSHPPSFPVESNVFIQTTTAYRRTPMTLEEQLRTFHEMGVRSGIRAYWAVYQWDWDGPTIKGELGLPRLVDDVRFYHANNVRSLNTEMSCNWGPRGLGYYLGARLLWNVKEDPKALIADFYEKAFGPAAPAMERYYARWYGDYARVTGAPGEAEPQAFNRESLRGAYADLDEAARLAKDSPAHLARIRDLQRYAHYLSLRLRLDEAAATKDRDAIVAAVRAETAYGARLMNTGMVHARPLIGKAFHRRFAAHAAHLKGLPEWPDDPTAGWNKGFRATRADVPTDEELAADWTADKAFLGL